MNATAQAYPPAARMIPESIAKALDSAAAAVKCPRRRDEEGHPFFDAEDVVPRCASAFRYYKLKLIAVSWSLAPIGSLIAVHRAGVIQSLEDGAELPVSTTWLVNLRDLPPGPAINAALTQSMAALYRVALELVTGDVEERPAPTRPITDSTSLGVSSRSKQSPSGARMSRQREEQSRERVDPEAVKAELDKAAREAFSEGSSGLAAHVDPDPTMPPTNAICVAHGVKGCAPCWGDELNPAIKDSGASSPESASVGTVPAEALQPDKGNGSTSPPAACKSGPESTSSATSTDGATPTDLIQPTPSQVKAVDLLARRVAESWLVRWPKSRAGKWARSKEREARKAFLCSVCQPSVPDGGPPAEWEPAIKKGDKHRDGEKAGRCCLKCYERLMAEAEPVKEGA